VFGGALHFEASFNRFANAFGDLVLPANYPSPNGPVGKAFDNTSSTQSRLQRRINDTSRLQREAIMDLQRLQAERLQFQPQPPAPKPAPNLLKRNPLPPQLGSFRNLTFQSLRRDRP
jgi:hypothetical protein